MLVTLAPVVLALATGSGSRVAPSLRRVGPAQRITCAAEPARRELLASSGALAAGLVAAGLPVGPASAGLFGGGPPQSAWTQVDIPVDTILFDVEFDSAEPNHGWIVGNKGTFLETTDGGKKWDQKAFANLDTEDEINYRFTKVSFKNGEGWVVGKPSILLHTKDGGKSWERIPLSPKLPGDPISITALGSGKAEMCTSQGAVYYTENAGRDWKAQVQETIEATLNRVSSSGVQGASYFAGSITNVLRNAAGEYLAISSRGNFFLTWQPGNDFWIPHNRATSKRISNMGFVSEDLKGGLWMSTNAGGLAVAKDNVDLSQVSLDFSDLKVNSAGFGILDLAYKNDKEIYAVGGSGLLLQSKDGGKSWKRDAEADNIPSNFYKIKFFGGDKGFILGSQGVLMRYTGA
mmetsp:Transcript_15383/g.41329  ORF Transcript_15383/g.41329 Transcript_15383/m.41329 type:complete len:405 (+) Transcript_15383:65-1279(+)